MAIAFLEGKNPTEKKKIIAAALLGVVALAALWMAFGRSFFGGSTTATAKTTATPRSTTPGTSSDKGDVVMPPASEQIMAYETTPIDYVPGNSYAPDAGRNIFAFYEPAPPCKDCPAPTPKPTDIKTPVPTPTPFYLAQGANPQSVYAGSQAFRLEVNGDRFTPDAQIYFNQSPMPTTFVNEQKLVTDIPANLIAQEGPRQVIVQSPDGKRYSDQVMMNVQAPPRPTVQYIGMIGRKRYNNDTAYFTEAEKPTPFGARLNDIVNNRFRLVAISPAEVTFQDVDLGFKHRVPLTKQPAAGPGGPGSPASFGSGGKSSPTNGGGFEPFDQGSVPTEIPGIPGSVKPYSPGQATSPNVDSGATQRKPVDKKDVDDDDQN
jgi:hypothetical protein